MAYFYTMLAYNFHHFAYFDFLSLATLFQMIDRSHDKH